MDLEKPVVYVFHGQDEFAIAREVSKLKAKLGGGDPSTADLNTTQLDGRTLQLDELTLTCMSVPFLAKRRLVIITNPFAGLTTPAAREDFLSILDKIPATTALVLIQNRPLTDERDRRNKKPHWLEKWARSAGKRAYLRQFDAKEGASMNAFIQQRAGELGGQFTPGAALKLSSLITNDTRLADQEIQKLLFYVNFNRPVEEDDVDRLTPFEGKLEDFALVNALRAKDANNALRVVSKQLEEDDPLRILGSIVYQFRLLLLARAVLDNGGTESDVAQQLSSKLEKVSSGVAYHAARHAVNFETSNLERIYHRLLETDTAIKTGEMTGELALETLVIQLTV